MRLTARRTAATSCKLMSCHPLPRGGAVWQLVGLITRRSKVQILPPQPIKSGSCIARSRRSRGSFALWPTSAPNVAVATAARVLAVAGEDSRKQYTKTDSSQREIRMPSLVYAVLRRKEHRRARSQGTCSAAARATRSTTRTSSSGSGIRCLRQHCRFSRGRKSLRLR